MRNLLAAILILSIAPLAQSQDKPDRWEFLRGVGPVVVVVEPLDKIDAILADLSTADLERETRLKLELSGVPVVDRAKSKPVFLVTVNGKQSGRRYVIGVTCMLLEKVILNRDPERVGSAATWEFSELLEMNSLRDSKPMISRCTEVFADLYVRANPPKKARTKQN